MRTVFPLLLLVPLVGCTRGTVVPPAPTAAAVGAYPSGGDTVRGVVHHPTAPGKFAAVVVVHGDYGLNDWAKGQARTLAELGYVALAVDLYRGEKVDSLMDAHIMDRGVPEERVRRDLKAAVDYLLTRPDVDPQRVGIVGWDMGGGYALDAAIEDRRLAAVVNCYGRVPADADTVRPLRAPVLYVAAGKHEGVTPAALSRFAQAMTDAGKTDRVTIQEYRAVGLGFMDPEHGGDSDAARAATEDAWRQIDAFLAKHLKRANP